MNLIKSVPSMKRTADEFMPVKHFRKHDTEKIDSIIKNMYRNIKEIDPEFNYEITWETNVSDYLAANQTYYDRLSVYQEYKENSNVMSVLIPQLKQENFFTLNGSNYVPLLFLEKCPIDRIYDREAKKNKIFININAVYNFTLDFEKRTVQFRSKHIAMDLFFRMMFKEDPEYLEYLAGLEFVDPDLIKQPQRQKIQDPEDPDGESKIISVPGFTSVSKIEHKKFCKTFMDFYKWDYFDNISVHEWMDKYLVLDYYREIFTDYYGTSTLNTIIKKAIEYQTEEIMVDMADLKNRRVVMTEYLIFPLFEAYSRLIYNIIDKKSQNFLVSINEFSVISSGFRKFLHSGNLYDSSNPYPTMLINKVSQDIRIINDGKLPKSWKANHKSGFGTICPISVSPQAMGLSLAFTNTARLNKYGRIKIHPIPEGE